MVKNRDTVQYKDNLSKHRNSRIPIMKIRRPWDKVCAAQSCPPTKFFHITTNSISVGQFGETFLDRSVLADVILMQRNSDPIALMLSTEAEVGNHNSVCKCLHYMYAIVKLSGPYHGLNLIQEWISNYI